MKAIVAMAHVSHPASGPEGQHSLEHVGRFRDVAIERGHDPSFYDNVTADQICIGQAIAVGCGEKVRFRAGVRGYDNNADTMFNTMEELRNIVTTRASMEEGGVISFAVSYHHQHATRVFVMRTGGVTYIWYYNPWGSLMDQQFSQRLHDNKLQGTPGYPDQQDTLDILRDSDELSCKEDVLEEWEARCVNHFLVPATELFRVPESHVMSYLEWKRSQSGRSDIHIIHPSLSMPAVGPQNQYVLAGCNPGNFLVQRACGMSIDVCPTADKWILGACCVWEELYSAHVRAEIENGVHPLQVIANLRQRDFLTGESSPRDLIGKFTYVLMPRDAEHGCGEALSKLESLIGSVPAREDVENEIMYSIGVTESYAAAVHAIDLMKVDGHLHGHDPDNMKAIQSLVSKFIKAVTREWTTESHRLAVKTRSGPKMQLVMVENILIYFLKFLLFIAACKQA
jgi:hypothetical protein